jgi:sugar phosphate permease
MGAGTPMWILIIAMVVLGIPQGLNNLAIQNTLYAQADPERIASSAGLLRTCMYIGGITASVIYGNVYGDRASTQGLHVLGWVVVGIAVVFLAITVSDRSLRSVGKVVPPDIEEARSERDRSESAQGR